MPYLEGRKWLLRFGVLHHLFLEEGEPTDLCNGGKSEASTHNQLIRSTTTQISRNTEVKTGPEASAGLSTPGSRWERLTCAAIAGVHPAVALQKQSRQGTALCVSITAD